MSRFRAINNDREHHRVLLELGLLDDVDDWSLYQRQEQKFFELDSAIDLATWQRYFGPARRCPPDPGEPTRP